MQKNIITFESCKCNLIEARKIELETLGMVLPIFLIIFVPFVCVFLYMAFSDDRALAARLVFGLIFAPIFAALPTYFIYQLVNTLFEMKMINNYNFSIVNDTVTRKETIFVRRHEEYVAHFQNSGKCNISKVEYELASTNDEYYVIILNYNKKALAAYPVSTYEFRDYTQEDF